MTKRFKVQSRTSSANLWRVAHVWHYDTRAEAEVHAASIRAAGYEARILEV